MRKSVGGTHTNMSVVCRVAVGRSKEGQGGGSWEDLQTVDITRAENALPLLTM
jgi:hypothetical protein